MKTLHLIAHPNINNSRVNQSWRDQLMTAQVADKTKELYALYPDFAIDVAVEQADLIAHDRIVLQFPFYWYSVPSLLKKWLDDVFLYGFAYGSEGNALKGKELQIITSTGGTEEVYSPDGFNTRPVPEYLYFLEQTAKLTGMKWRPPLIMHGSHAADDDKIRAHGERWVAALRTEEPVT